MPTLYIIAGCNGSGKTTIANTLLPGYLNCNEFVNADMLAAGMKPFSSQSASVKAGKLMLNIVKELIDQRVDFSVETTLSGHVYKGIIEACH